MKLSSNDMDEKSAPSSDEPSVTTLKIESMKGFSDPPDRQDHTVALLYSMAKKLQG